MKTLLEFYLKYCDFLYLDSQYRFTDSKTDGGNASLMVTGADLQWSIANDRGQIQISVGPTTEEENKFWISLIRQYVNRSENIHYLSAVEEVEWARMNIKQIGQLFSATSNLESTCTSLRALMRSNGEKQWGPTTTN